MLKLDIYWLVSLDVSKWGALACYGDMSGDTLDSALVQAARALGIEYSKIIKGLRHRQPLRVREVQAREVDRGQVV